MKLTINDQVVEVVFNPGRKNDGRPDASLEYTATLRQGSDGVVRLTLATDFTPPCLAVEWTEMAGAESVELLRQLGLTVLDEEWEQRRNGSAAFLYGIRYAPATEDELAFMASFGFTPGARFNLALPMLRAMRAELTSGWRGEIRTVDAMERAAEKAVQALPTLAEDDPGWSPAQKKILGEMQAVEDSLVAAGVDPKAPIEKQAPPLADLSASFASSMPDKPAKQRRRRAVKADLSAAPGDVQGVADEVDPAVADVFAVLDERPYRVRDVTSVEPNPFAIEGL